MLQRYSDFLVKAGMFYLFLNLHVLFSENFVTLLSAHIYLMCVSAGFMADFIHGKSRSILIVLILQLLSVITFVISAFIPHFLSQFRYVQIFGQQVHSPGSIRLFVTGLYIFSAGLFRPNIYALLGQYGVRHNLNVKCTLFYFFNRVGVYAGIYTFNKVIGIQFPHEGMTRIPENNDHVKTSII